MHKVYLPIHHCYNALCVLRWPSRLGRQTHRVYERTVRPSLGHLEIVGSDPTRSILTVGLESNFEKNSVSLRLLSHDPTRLLSTKRLFHVQDAVPIRGSQRGVGMPSQACRGAGPRSSLDPSIPRYRAAGVGVLTPSGALPQAVYDSPYTSGQDRNVGSSPG